ncbi:MAG: hypothetical protein HKO10_09500 [Acidimicrobiia bacterium]|nr:hypothetical protein [Acidimicrobiia bacterium]
MGELENAWKSVTNAFKSLGSELKDQYEKATSDDRPEDEIAAERKGKSEVAAALDPASELRDDLKSDEDQEAALAAVDDDEDLSSAFDRARHYLEQAASTVGKVAKEDSTKKAAKDAASAMGDALSATFAELKKALKMDDDDETSAVEADSPAEDQSDDSGGSKSDGGSNPES